MTADHRRRLVDELVVTVLPRGRIATTKQDSRLHEDPAERIGSIAERYQRPGWFTKNVFNRAVAGLTRLGVSVAGSRILEVRGRKSGEPRRTPVNLLTLDGTRYLVAPRGHTQWVRNLRAQGEGRLLVGRRAESFTASEIADEDKPAILRAYLERWKWEVGAFFGGVGPDSPDDELRRIAPDHPIFRISSRPGPATES
jgi:deazaflavin-dependent oxidoreductase (nitroreductase family)